MLYKCVQLKEWFETICHSRHYCQVQHHSYQHLCATSLVGLFCSPIASIAARTLAYWAPLQSFPHKFLPKINVPKSSLWMAFSLVESAACYLSSNVHGLPCQVSLCHFASLCIIAAWLYYSWHSWHFNPGWDQPWVGLNPDVIWIKGVGYRKLIKYAPFCCAVYFLLLSIWMCWTYLSYYRVDTYAQCK